LFCCWVVEEGVRYRLRARVENIVLTPCVHGSKVRHGECQAGRVGFCLRRNYRRRPRRRRTAVCSLVVDGGFSGSSWIGKKVESLLKGLLSGYFSSLLLLSGFNAFFVFQ